MKVVVDASVAVKWVLPDPAAELDADRARDLLMRIRKAEVSPLQPPHWLSEVAAVLSRLHPGVSRRAVEILYAMELPMIDDLEIYRRACDLADRLNRHVFDTLYHAVALVHEVPLITADDHYYRKARSLGGLIRLRSLADL